MNFTMNFNGCSPFSFLLRVLFALLLLILGVQAAHAERKTTYYHTDGLGSVVAASNDAGALLWRKVYAPFGEQTDSTGENEKVAYTGKEHDDSTGLTYFGARYYDPHLGRFMSVDPAGFVETEPMTFNRYSYGNNNPYKYVDPDGEFVNFAAKFVLDVGLNVAINYVTTGELNVGGALKESAVGVLNPAKTLATAGKLAMALKKTDKLEKFTVRRFMGKAELKKLKKEGLTYDPAEGQGISTTTTNFTPKNQSIARKKTGANKVDYQVDLNVSGIPRAPTTNTKGGLPEYKIQGDITPDKILNIKKVPK